jgi:DNA-nicking Smr family endonuclease
MDALRGATPNMDAKTFGRLKRGKLAPEARIDLHGMSAERAHAALRMFIADAYARQLRLVLVITGKGRRDHPDDSPSRRGVLRNELPHWLAQPPLSLMVLQTAPAHIRHGGGGAYYVYLRRRR